MFTSDEIDILVEALTAWENKDAAGELMGAVFTAMISKDEESFNKNKEINDKKTKAMEEAKKQREIASIKLKAKLYEIKEGMEMERVTGNRKILNQYNGGAR